MKRTELLRKIAAQGAIFLRHGGNHDIYMQPQTRVQQPVPRHGDVPDLLARRILKKLSQQA
jgi:predicted RNA binding protein YcfA (HicA-like mRNA interferase family)